MGVDSRLSRVRGGPILSINGSGRWPYLFRKGEEGGPIFSRVRDGPAHKEL